MKPLHAGMLVVCTVFDLCVCAAGPAAGDAQIEREIRMLEAQEVQAVLAHDAETLERLWDKGYVVHNPEGRIVPAGPNVMARPVFQNPRASFTRKVESVVVNGDVAISMGSEIVTLSAEPSKVGDVIKRRYTDVWMRKEGAWKLVARHANRICGQD